MFLLVEAPNNQGSKNTPNDLVSLWHVQIIKQSRCWKFPLNRIYLHLGISGEDGLAIILVQNVLPSLNCLKQHFQQTNSSAWNFEFRLLWVQKDASDVIVHG